MRPKGRIVFESGGYPRAEFAHWVNSSPSASVLHTDHAIKRLGGLEFELSACSVEQVVDTVWGGLNTFHNTACGVRGTFCSSRRIISL